MIKVTVGEQIPQEEKPFPKLMKNENGAICLMFSPENGVLLISVIDNPIGIYEISDASYTDFNEPITLQNA